MIRSASPEASSAESLFAPDADMPPFLPGQCLFCPYNSPSFSDSLVHMQKAHGLFVPDQQHIAVDLETLFQHLHLLIFGYHACIQCGTERATVQAVQQHMTGKGHCTLNIATLPRTGPLRVDDASIRLPSGKIISKRASTPASAPSPPRRRLRPLVALEHAGRAPQEGKPTQDSLLSRRERRERAAATYQLASLSAHDCNSLVHLSVAQQRVLLAAQHRQADRGQKEEDRRRSRVDRKGNKNLYAYWATQTPVYLCG